jgi:hypothetical protein
MRVIRFLLWTSLMVGFGIFLSRYKVLGRTPLDHAQTLWQAPTTQTRLQHVEQKAHDAIEDAKVHLGSSKAPREHHSADERSAVEKLIAQRAAKK